MGTRIVPDRMSGILLPDTRLEFWEDESGVFDSGGTKESDLGQASPYAGIAVPGTASECALRSSGNQSASIDVECNRAGLPVLDGLGYLVGDDGATDAELMGCDLPVPLGGHQSVSSNDQRFYPHVIPIGVEIEDVAAMVVYSDATGNIYSRTVTDTEPWTAEVTIDSATVTNTYPCLLRLPSGRVLCFRWGDSGSDHQVRAWYTDDDGATWAALGPVLEEDLSATTYPTRKRLRAVYLDGVIALFGAVTATDTGAGIWRSRIVQWASSDGGYTFQEVTVSDGSDETKAGAWHDVCVWRGEIILSRLTYTSSGGGGVEIAVRRLPSAWYPWTTADELSQTGSITSGFDLGTFVAPVPATSDGSIAEGELALWADDDTALYMAARHCQGAYDGASPILRSPDGGENWFAPGSSLVYAGRGQAWHWNGAAATEAYSTTACSVHGHGLAVYATESTHIGSDRLYSAWLGGWQSVPMPTTDQSIKPTRRTAWHNVGVASHRPDECGWTRFTVGAPTETITPGVLTHTTAAGEQVQYSIIPSGTLAQGMICEHGLEVSQGQAEIRLRLQDATPQDFDCEVRVTPTTILLYDNNAAAQVGSTTNYSGGPVAIRCSMEGDAVRIFAHIPGDVVALASSAELCGQRRSFAEVAKTPSLTAGAGGGSNQIFFVSTQNSTVYWYWWPFVSNAYCGDHLYTQPNRQKFPRSLVESPSSAIRSVRLSSVTGPAVVGDTWDVDQDALYPYDAVLTTHSPSPRHPWRDDGSALGALVGATGPTGRLSWRMESAAVELGMSALWGVILDGLSMGGVEVYLRYGAAWNLVSAVGYWTMTANAYGRTLEVNTGGALNSAVLRRDELAGCLLEVVSGGTPATQSDEQHLIVRNDPGHINTTAGLSLPLRIELDDTPVAANPFTIRIYPRRALLLVDLSLYQQRFEAIQIRWPIPRRGLGNPYPIPGPSPLGYHEIATAAMGPVYPFGIRHSHGRRLAIEADTEVLTAEDGTRTAYERGPARRRESLTWSELVPMQDYLEEDDPKTIAYKSGGTPLAFRWSTPADLQDILRTLTGSKTVIGWCPSIDSEGTGRPDHWADGAFLARLTSAIERDLVYGDEERSASERVQGATFEEEV